MSFRNQNVFKNDRIFAANDGMQRTHIIAAERGGKLVSAAAVAAAAVRDRDRNIIILVDATLFYYHTIVFTTKNVIILVSGITSCV